MLYALQIQSKFFRKDDTHQFKPFLLGFNFSFCHEDPKYRLIPYADKIIDHLRTYSNVNHSCPYSVRRISMSISID